jgi:uncharacterized protein
LQTLEIFNQDPQSFLSHYNDRVIFDEAQFAPQLFNAIKIRIDNDRRNYGKFVLSGSSQFSFIQSITESLAGRIGLMTLLPLQFTEMPRALQEASIFEGSYPELVLRDYRESALWYSSYLDTYLNKDVRVISNIGDLRDLRRFIYLLAAHTSQTLDLTYYAKILGVSAPTIKRWVSILEASYVIFLIPPFYNNYGKRITKSPKIYFYDTGLVSYLTGLTTFDQYNQGPLSGPLFENYIVSEINKKHKHSASTAELFSFALRTKQKFILLSIINHTKNSLRLKNLKH